jgi:hypothetical protein
LDLIITKTPLEHAMNIFFATFCVLPPALLGAKTYAKWRISSWWLFAGFVVVGWILVNLAIWWKFEELGRLASLPGASDELMDAAQTDGAARVFGMLFGWAYAALYFGAWAFAFGRGVSLYEWFHKKMGGS